MYDFIVVGMGLIGSAALRYLSQSSTNVLGIGPGEPAAYRDHKGVFASHYDQARITRILDDDLIWATMAKRSIAKYREIEEQSGITFYSEIGCLRAVHALEEEELTKTKRVGDELDVTYASLDSINLKGRFPFLQFADGTRGLFEGSNAGFINPRLFIDAQLRIAQDNRANVVRETVISVKRNGAHIVVKTDHGSEHLGKKVLITAGAFSNCNNLIEQELAVKAVARTVLLAKLSSESVKRLATMPSILFNAPEGTSIYALPPVQYPNGSFYVKIGSGIVDANLQSLEQFQAFFGGVGSTSTAKFLQGILESLLPDVSPLSYLTAPCVVAKTETDRPYIDTILPSQVFVATGGCGKAAKSSDEIGRLAASLVLQEKWHDELEAAAFKSHFGNSNVQVDVPNCCQT